VHTRGRQYSFQTDYRFTDYMFKLKMCHTEKVVVSCLPFYTGKVLTIKTEKLSQNSDLGWLVHINNQ
jgi:hypothetical protein